MSTNDYVKFMTEQFILHLETPRSERKQLRRERKEGKPPLLVQWFGLIPLSLSMLLKKRRDPD